MTKEVGTMTRVRNKELGTRIKMTNTKVMDSGLGRKGRVEGRVRGRRPRVLALFKPLVFPLFHGKFLRLTTGDLSGEWWSVNRDEFPWIKSPSL